MSDERRMGKRGLSESRKEKEGECGWKEGEVGGIMATFSVARLYLCVRYASAGAGFFSIHFPFSLPPFGFVPLFEKKAGYNVARESPKAHLPPLPLSFHSYGFLLWPQEAPLQ
jgi:hypothetical protein